MTRPKLPINRQLLKSCEEHPPTDFEPKHRRVLLVVRDELLLQDLAGQLACQGHEVSIAKTGIAYLAHVRSHPVDLLVLDPEVPWGDDDGLLDAGLIDGLRLLDAIVLARHMNPALARFGIRMAFYLFEPIDATTVITCVRDCLGWRFETCY